MDFIDLSAFPNTSTLKLSADTCFIEEGAPLDFIYVQLKGSCYIVNYTASGRRIIADTLHGVQIYGLIEALHQRKNYLANVITLSSGTFAKIPVQLFLSALDKNLNLSNLALRYIADFLAKLMESEEQRSSSSPLENFLYYLYHRVLHEPLPYTITENKAFLSDYLHIDKRSLYRYLKQLEEEAYLSRDKQNILIHATHLENIKKRLGLN